MACSYVAHGFWREARRVYDSALELLRPPSLFSSCRAGANAGAAVAVPVTGAAEDDEDGGARETLATILHHHALAHYHLEDHDASLRSVGQSLSLRENLLGREHFRFLRTLRLMGDALAATCRYTAAVSCYESAVQIMRRDPRKDRMLIAELLEGKGAVLTVMGELDEATECLNESLCWKMEEMGMDDAADADGASEGGDVRARRAGAGAEALSSVHARLGEIHGERGDMDAALSEYDEALRLIEASAASSSSSSSSAAAAAATDDERVSALLIEGRQYELAFDHEEALHYYERALDLLRSCMPHRRDGIADVLHCIGRTHAGMGDHKSAAKMFQDSIGSRRARGAGK